MSVAKRPWNSGPPRQQKGKKRKVKPVLEGAKDDVLLVEVNELIRTHGTASDEASDSELESSVPKLFEEIEVKIIDLSATGEGLGLLEDGNRVVIVPFTVPGDKVVARIYQNSNTHSQADLVKVLEPSDRRDDTLVKCRYFGKCSGCQLQMTAYEDQLDFKRNIIVKAFRRYFGSESTTVPEIDHTHPSPLQYGYRTKITPHFEIPRSKGKDGPGEMPDTIGFIEKGRKRLVDIEECVIARPSLNVGLAKERAIVKQKHYKRGATLLLREADDTTAATGDSEEIPKKYVTDHKQIITEHVNEFKFEFPAGSFFQNNNSILPGFTGYVHDQIEASFQELDLLDQPRFLVDAYCGSGLFSVTCSRGFESVIGVEITAESVNYAVHNAKANNIANAKFITGSADRIFDVVHTPPDHTAVIIDPPRKGCDDLFLNQLLKFNPRVIVYVSCNVHTQARDIDFLLKKKGDTYKITAIRGFDLFPQTHHVESIATLVRYQRTEES